MAEESLSEPSSNIPSILMHIMSQNDILLKLNMVDTVLSAIDEDKAKKIDAQKLKAYLHKKYLGDPDFMRRLKLNSTITNHPELSLEYYGQDFLTHEEYNFNADQEKEFAELNKLLNLNIGLLLKEYLKGDNIEF